MLLSPSGAAAVGSCQRRVARDGPAAASAPHEWPAATKLVVWWAAHSSGARPNRGGGGGARALTRGERRTGEWVARYRCIHKATRGKLLFTLEVVGPLFQLLNSTPCFIGSRGAGQDADARAHHLFWRQRAVLRVHARLLVVWAAQHLRRASAWHQQPVSSAAANNAASWVASHQEGAAAAGHCAGSQKQPGASKPRRGKQQAAARQAAGCSGKAAASYERRVHLQQVLRLLEVALLGGIDCVLQQVLPGNKLGVGAILQR